MGLSSLLPSSRFLLLGLLLLPAAVTLASAEPEEAEGDLGCVCLKTTSHVRPKRIVSLEVVKAGPHCARAQLIATLKKGRKICLDPQAALYQRVVRRLLESERLAPAWPALAS